jgi:hypothetical protein
VQQIRLSRSQRYAFCGSLTARVVLSGFASYKTSLVPSSPFAIWSFEIFFRCPARFETTRTIIVPYPLLPACLPPHITYSSLAYKAAQGSVAEVVNSYLIILEHVLRKN